MPSKTSTILVSAAVLAVATQTSEAFRPTTSLKLPSTAATTNSFSLSRLYAEETKEASTSPDAVFLPPESNDDDEESDVDLDAVEMMGRGAAKAKRGKRKGGSAAPAPTKASVSLTPEEVFYEGPPAITETIIPTISILTVVGIIPAIASWSRQAWVRYKITTRRIRVTSGIGGKDMAEIVYPDIVEIRTAKRLFGDGDMVAFLRDGAKFEMRNIPEFDATMEFILKQVDPDVAKQYRAKGDVTNP
ncbi:ribonuclease P [Nitzschia inconspicua]|uniref:Ribonuclease P n=1 Tax=Nitzschia inconspicua TaxID=303405 RepID=A0A9K3Q2H6_9STRA|nr:ribonuclease P [Nitzschia inconspicua]